MQHIGEMIFTVLDMVMYASAVTLFLSLYFTFTEYNLNAELAVNEKVNIVELSGEYTEKENEVSPSAVLSEIKEIPLSVSIKIGSYHVTEKDRIELKEYHNASSLSSRVESNRNYEKEYTYDGEGRIVEVIYRLL